MQDSIFYSSNRRKKRCEEIKKERVKEIKNTVERRISKHQANVSKWNNLHADGMRAV